MMREEVIYTKIVKGKTTELTDYRNKRIKEALSFESGTKENPLKYVITNLNDGTEVYFLKPGKEVFNVKRPNPHDMTPCIGEGDERFRFDEIWTYLSNISAIDFNIFKAVLTLIYRNAYFIDHKETEKGEIRYLPDDNVTAYINEIEDKVGHILPNGIWGLLHFLDILGWNEDVKYHTEKNVPTFNGKYGYKVGRLNTLMTCIRVPYQASSFVKHVIDHFDDIEEIDFLSLYTIMQQFSKSRGTCIPTQENLIEWLSPFFSNVSPTQKQIY